MYDNTTAKSCICAATRSLIKYQSNKSCNVLHLNDSVNQETTNSCTLHISIMMIMRPSLDLLIIISNLSQRKFDAHTHNQVYSFARHNFHSTFLLCQVHFLNLCCSQDKTMLLFLFLHVLILTSSPTFHTIKSLQEKHSLYFVKC